MDMTRDRNSPIGYMRYSDQYPISCATNLCPISWRTKLSITRTNMIRNIPMTQMFPR